MLLVAFIAAKFCLYCMICFLAVRIMNLAVESTQGFVLKWGVIRLAIGFVSGFFVSQAFDGLQTVGISDWLSYIVTFAPARYVEWLIVLRLMARRHKIHVRARGQLWVLLGTLVSIVSDQLVLASGVDSLQFFC
jgi:hypothetical protein